MAPKRAATNGNASKSPEKKPKIEPQVSMESSEELSETPFAKLLAALTDAGKSADKNKVENDNVVVYWMRNKDLRLTDNRALALASATAEQHSIPLIVLHVFSPSDYKAHDVAARRVDFQIRALHLLAKDLDKKNVPLYTVTWDDRWQISQKIGELMKEWKASHLFGNLEYEVDELKRDTSIIRSAAESRESGGKGDGQGWSGEVSFVKDFCIVGPGEIVTQQGKPYSVFSPWYRNWAATVTSNIMDYLDDVGTLKPNPASARKHSTLEPLFGHQLPKHIAGFKLSTEDQKTMNHLWPVGAETVASITQRFLTVKIRTQAFQHPPLHPGGEEVDIKKSKIGVYSTGRNRVDLDGTSHLSAYFATGMISPRESLRALMKYTNGKLTTDKESGIGMWVSEVAWRDFYQHVLSAWPRVCMRKPFNLKYEDIVWEDEHFEAWCKGRTGFPIVDAAMRALNEQGYMHNRCRMIVAMFLSKDLMLDWRRGEKYFNQKLIDGDFASNNGGWQWSASTGTDPQPYFRVFNPTAQSEKSDPEGDYIRHWVPELAKLKGKAIHDPSSNLSKKEIEKIGYCMPIVDHAKARVRAIARFKNPGERVDE